MRINIQNMLRQTAGALPRGRDSGAYGFVLGKLSGHLRQLRDRTESGDLTALDEFFELYVFDDGKKYSRQVCPTPAAENTRIEIGARAFVKAVDTDEQIAAVSKQARDEWIELADAVITIPPTPAARR